MTNDPIQITPDQIVSSTKLVRNLSNYLDVSARKPLFVTRYDEIEHVLISIDSYRELLKTKEERKIINEKINNISY